MGRIIWACRAADQLEALVEFIAKGSPREARRFAARVLHRIASLGTHPELGGWVIEDETRTYREAIMHETFVEPDAADLAAIIGRLGAADVRSFGLTWEDCEQLLKRLGYTAHVDITTA
jgi:plasmid stabilization system protein ParE